MVEEEKKNKVSWNIAANQAQFIFELIKKSMTYYQTGILSRWYWTLSSLREMINHDLNIKQREDLDEIEKEIQTSLKYWSKYQAMKDGHTENKMSRKELSKKNLFAVHVRKYQRRLMDLLNELGYFPSKEDRSRINF